MSKHGISEEDVQALADVLDGVEDELGRDLTDPEVELVAELVIDEMWDDGDTEPDFDPFDPTDPQDRQRAMREVLESGVGDEDWA